MTAWTKRGLIFDTLRQGVGGWMRHSALTPTPWRISDGVIRVYASFRDDDGVGRIGFVDLDAERPDEVLGVSAQPVLDVGRGGCFDDNGMILGDIVEGPGGLHMFYVGFQRVARAKFLAFSGLALSTDGGHTFARTQETPVLDRGPGRSSIAAIHSAMYEGGRWRLWYAAGDGWETIGGQPYPRYHIRYTETEHLHGVPTRDHVCLMPQGNEYRIGRPRVYRHGQGYVMYFTRGDTRGGYFPGCATSTDGIHWERHDELFGLALSERGWDSRTISYPALHEQAGRTLMFYNGNDMGVDGFGMAEALHA
jgi:hypothetical protein